MTMTTVTILALRTSLPLLMALSGLKKPTTPCGRWKLRSVAISGDTVVVGAGGDDDNGDYYGSAYIYRFDGSSWIETKLLASDAVYDDSFGYSVAISGDTIVVGAAYDDDNGEYSGSAYIYRFDGKHWIEETKLLASDGGSGLTTSATASQLSDGDTVVVGAP